MRSILSPAMLFLCLAACASGGKPAASTAPAPQPSASVAPGADAATSRFREVLPGLHTGGQPDAADLARLHALGVRTVIDLRGAGEDRGYDEAAEAQRLGMAYVSLPVAGAEGVTLANANALQALLEQHGDGVVLHCASGNRVGALLALGAADAGMPHEQALALGREAGLKSLEPVVIERLQAPSPAGEADR